MLVTVKKKSLSITKSNAYPKELNDLLEVHRNLFFSVNTGIKKFRVAVTISFCDDKEW